jgi:transposase InsO family protein
MTFVRTEAGYLLLSILLDHYSRRIVGWAIGERPDTRLSLAALGMALLQRRPKPGLIHHSDRGWAYASPVYRTCLKRNGIIPSMSAPYTPKHNAEPERFFRYLKQELVNGTYLPTFEGARTAIFEYIEIFYNRQRRHGGLGYISPMEFEERTGQFFVTL